MSTPASNPAERPRWKRVVLKLSGEALGEPGRGGIDVDVVHQLVPNPQVGEPVTIPLTVVTQEALEMVAPAVPLILKLLDPPIVKLISPVFAS